MSPSRIPRPQGGVPPSPLGPNAEQYRINADATSNGSPKTIHAGAFHHGHPPTHHPSSPDNPSPTSSPAFKPNPSFIQPRSPQPGYPPSAGLSPPSNPAARLPQSRSRRPKPPPEDDSTSGMGSPQAGQGSVNSPGTPTQAPSRRRQVTNAGSPDPNTSGIPRPSRGVGSPTVAPGASNGPGPGNRSCSRQPSVPALSAHRDREVVKPRTRATSAAADTRPPTDEPKPPMPLFAPSFAESREPSVPPHIRIRLRLIHQLGVVLGIDAQGISSKIDVPGLLARVDAAYDRGYQGAGGAKMNERGRSSSSMSSRAGVSSISGLPMPTRPGADTTSSPEVRNGGRERDKDKERGMFGMFKRFGKDKGVGKDEERTPFAFTSHSPEGLAFAVSLNDAPAGSWCTSLIGGQKHELPLVVFTIVEEIYRRGMSQPGIFRLAGDGTRISHLTKVFNLPPLYGDSLSIVNEPIHNLTGLVKRYIRDLPEPILDESLFQAFLSFCAEPEPGALVLPLTTRISAAQILLKLLPPLHFSLLIYLLAFLGQLPLFPDNRLNVESISIIFGPAICAARGKGISGLGVGASGGRLSHDPDVVSNLVNQSQATLAWLLRNWAAISEKVLEPPFDDDEADASKAKDEAGKNALVDPRLLSPIDLRTAAGDAQNPFTRPRSQSQSQSQSHSNTPRAQQSKPVPLDLELDKREAQADEGRGMTRSATISPSPSSGSGIFARAFSSMNIAAQAKGADEEKVPKRSASFTSLSSLVKKGGAFMRNDREPKSAVMTWPKVNPQISNVLGSLHDLLVSKDKQIERDARELALLRHTLLEMDEKLQRASSCQTSPLPGPAGALPSSPCSCGSPASSTVGTPPTPAITITSTPSTTTLLAKEKEITDIHAQLTTALAALETARLQSRKQAEKTLDLEAKLARADSEKRLERGKLEVALALEQAKAATLIDERDVARDRLEKIKTTLFAVA